MDNLFKFSMFFTSFLPLWFSITFSNVWSIITKLHQTGYSKGISFYLSDSILEICLSIALITASVFTMIYISRFLKNKINSFNRPVAKIIKSKKANNLSSEYLLAYILPLIAFDYSSLRDVGLFLIYFFVLSFLYLKNSNVYTNIFLKFKGYDLYFCDLQLYVMGEPHIYYDCFVISRNNLTSKINHEIEYYDFQRDIYLNLDSSKL